MLKKDAIGIVGSGALGALLSEGLKRHQESVFLFSRDQKGENQLSLRYQDKVVELRTDPHARSTECSHLIFCTKAFDLENALREFIPKAPYLKHILYLSNGYTEPDLKFVKKKFSSVIFRQGISTIGVSQRERGEFIRTSQKGNIIWGSNTIEAPTKLDEILISQSPQWFKWVTPIEAILADKFLANVVINSLSAAHKLKCNGDLLNHVEELEKVFSEAYLLTKKVYKSYSRSNEDAYEFLISLINTTSNNENSMALDIRLSRPTESRYLAGVADTYPNVFPLLSSLHQQIESHSLH